MGCTTREKSVKNRRRLRSNNPTSSVRSEEHVHDDKRTNNTIAKISSNNMSTSREEKPKEKNAVYEETEESDWGYCTEEQLKDLLLKSLEFVYNKAVCKIASGGYGGDEALKAVLRSGHYHGSGDLFSDIVKNAMMCLKDTTYNWSNGANIVFRDLKQLQEYALTRLVCFVRQFRPELSKGDAMWSLLMSDLHVGRAIALEIPSIPTADERLLIKSDKNYPSPSIISMPSPIRPSCLSSNLIPIGVDSEPCGMCSGKKRIAGLNAEQADKVIVDASSLLDGGFTFDAETSQLPLTGTIHSTPNACWQSSMKLSLLRKNAAWLLHEYKSKSDICSQSDGGKNEDLVFSCETQKVQTQSQSFSEKNQFLTPNLHMSSETTAVSTRNPAAATGSSLEIASTMDAGEDQFKGKPRNCPDILEAILGSLKQTGVGEKSDCLDQQNEIMLKLMHQIRDLEMQLKEQTEWAQQRAMQAARKLGKDFTELKQLRMERDDTLHLEKDKRSLEDTRVKRVAEMENALRKASSQIDQSNAAVRRLETENAEMRAEMEASKLNSAESVATYQGIEKREKKSLRKTQTWEKQKSKLQGEIDETKQNIYQVQKQLSLIKDLQQETEAKLKQDENAKEFAIAQAEEARRARDAAEAAAKRREESLHRKTEMNFQRHKDDIERLEQELVRLKAKAVSFQPNTMPSSQNEAEEVNAKIWKEKNLHLLNKFQELQESSQRERYNDRQCVMCRNEVVSIVFLPCAHQVVCVECNNLHEKKGLENCPFCRSLIQQRIHVYGASM
ncbi:MND1-interacting protein 1 [Cryptomeria japonica]|uniref:MND1-interacting protein 1 n=1 Tax=Cryptomeria japonica TaxID=3369 RepID=UPI0025AC4615|nr:MND1-interacting protein 1 [Cryptomeria japonica]